MKSLSASLPRLALLGLALFAHPLFAQGPLAPTTGPQPMMKTLLEMEPRTHIAAAGFVISAPGSYYLTANLNGGGTQNGITVQASGVTIDLRGFSIENCLVGISASSGTSNISVANGMVRNSTNTGVDLSSASQCRIEGVMVSGNGGDGARSGAGSLITLTTASGNSGVGVVLGNNGTVFRCVAQTNAGGGIGISSNCQATENTCTGNGSGPGQAGLVSSGSNNRVEGNSSNSNNGHGFLIVGTGNLVIRNNSCGNSAPDYAIAGGNNYGQILVTPGAGFNSSNAWANFGCSPLPSPCQTSTQCHDANPCTQDVCQQGACVNTPIPDCDCTDNDQDGIYSCEGDCNDNDPSIRPGVGETCDDGIDNDCNGQVDEGCGPPVCGDGFIQAGEACDDGNMINGDGCSSVCQLEQICGNGIIEGSETCDDGNMVAGDGCSFDCQTEGQCLTASECPGVDTECQYRTCTQGICGISFQPYGTPAQSQTSGDCKTDVCNGGGSITSIPEDADLPNQVSGDCKTYICYEGSIYNPPDNADLPEDDGNQCTFQACISGNPAYQNLQSGSPCNQNGGNECDGNGMCVSISVCGNGVTEAGETCDDGNELNGDGCSAVCTGEVGYVCSGSPSVCTTICGDGVIRIPEACDDGNTNSGDGCSSACTVEPGFACTGSPSVCFQ